MQSSASCASNMSASGEEALVGRDQRQVVAVGEIDQVAFDPRSRRPGRGAELDVEPAGKNPRPDAPQHLSAAAASCRSPSSRPTGPSRAAGQHDQAFGVRCQVARSTCGASPGSLSR